MSVISGIWGAESSEEAAETQADAARHATQIEERIYWQNRADMMPWRDAGVWALGRPRGIYGDGEYLAYDFEEVAKNKELREKIQAGEYENIEWDKKGYGLYGMIQQGPGKFEKSPGYEFRMQEGQKALERSAAARGRLDSGATMKAITKYGQDYASNEYDKFLARYYQSLTPYQSLAGLGMTSAGTMANLSSQTGENIANTTMAGGTARASGYINKANAISNMSQNTMTGLALANEMGWLGDLGKTYMI